MPRVEEPVKAIAIVQARMSSRRLPGKVLRRVADKPMLQFVVEGLARCRRLDGLVVATSACAQDDPVARWCETRATAVHRGPLEDVAERFRQVIDAYDCDAFVRVNGDSPLLDHRLVDRGVSLLRDGGFDLVTNVWPRTFPRGQSVEVLRCDAFRRGCRDIVQAQDLEHVTRYFYRNPDSWRIHNFTADRDASASHLAVDDAEQMAAFEAVVARMDRPHWEYRWDEVLALHEDVRMAAAEPAI